MNKTFKILIIAFVFIFMLCISAGALSKMGSTGKEVSDIQSRLQSLGYYTGKIDGIYGIATKNAVVNFQKANGLVADGVVGSKTMAALGLNSSGAYNSSDYELLARVISAEARGETYLGQVAVGAVVLNRVEHPFFRIRCRAWFIKTELFLVFMTVSFTSR